MKHTAFSLVSATSFVLLTSVSVTTAANLVVKPVGMPNPASVFCVDSGGTSTIQKNADGSESGNCKLPDGRSVEEWDFYRKSTYDIVSVTEPAKNFSTDVKAKYPAYRDALFARFNRTIAAYVNHGISETKASANIPDSEASKMTSYGSRFETFSSTNTVSAVMFTEAYQGGAHGIEDIRVFLSRKDGKPLTFRKFLFGNKESLQTFAFRTQLEMIKKYPDLGKKNFVEATDAKWSNFTHVAIDGEEAIVYFNTYAIGTRPDGSQSVRVSLKGLRTLDVWD